MKIQVKVDNETYEVEIIDLNKRPVLARIGNDIFEVWPEKSSNGKIPAKTTTRSGEPSQRMDMGLQQTQLTDIKTVLSPLPGTVIEVMVKAGAHVAAGDTLMVIEAMKMKNNIRAGRAGTIAKVDVNTGQTVQHKQVLVEFTE